MESQKLLHATINCVRIRAGFSDRRGCLFGWRGKSFPVRNRERTRCVDQTTRFLLL